MWIIGKVGKYVEVQKRGKVLKFQGIGWFRGILEEGKSLKFDEMRIEEHGWDGDSERNGIEKSWLCGCFCDSPLCIGNCQFRGQKEDGRNGSCQFRQLPLHILKVGFRYGNSIFLYNFPFPFNMNIWINPSSSFQFNSEPWFFPLQSTFEMKNRWAGNGDSDSYLFVSFLLSSSSFVVLNQVLAYLIGLANQLSCSSVEGPIVAWDI